MDSSQKETYTIDDIYELPDGQRAELFDGQIYMKASPNRLHQKLLMKLSWIIESHIQSKKGDCEVYPAPFAVYLNADNQNYVEPDISVICDKNKLDDRGCVGAPDWIIEIASPYTQQRDYGIKLFKYRSAGVREYWIINPRTEIVQVFNFEKEENSNQYTFAEEVPAGIYEDLTIRVSDYM